MKRLASSLEKQGDIRVLGCGALHHPNRTKKSRVFYPRSMQNRTFSRILGVLLYCLSVSDSQSEIHHDVEVLLHAYEITDAERSLLNKLPPEVVALLTERLNAVEAAQPTEARLFGLLHAKIEQFIDVLPQSEIEAAISALERKSADARTPYREFRQKNLASVRTLYRRRLDRGTSSNALIPIPKAVAPKITDSGTPVATNWRFNSESTMPLSVIAILISAMLALGWLHLRKEH
jgi:hypothetical protein